MLDPPALILSLSGSCLRHHGTAIRAGEGGGVLENQAMGRKAVQSQLSMRRGWLL
jgi:hypothetical protein